MINQKRDRLNSFGISVFFALFILLLSSSDISVKKSDNTFKHILESEVLSSNLNAVIAENIQLPSVQKSCEYIPIQLFNENFKLFDDNRKINQSFILLHKTQLSIKPIAICRFYYHLFSEEDDDWPILS